MEILRYKDRPGTTMEKPKGGEGVVEFTAVLRDPSVVGNEIEKFNIGKLAPGHGLGWHRHEGNTETICIISGTADYTGNEGKHYILEKGDTAFCDNMEFHSMYCTGDEPLTFIALIVKKA